MSPPWSLLKEKAVTLTWTHPASPAPRLHVASDAKCVPCYSSATQINPLLSDPIHLSHKSACFVVPPAAAMHNLRSTPPWVKKLKTRRCNNNSLLLSFTFPVAVSFFLSFSVIWRHCRGWHSCSFTPNEIMCLTDVIGVSWWWQIFTHSQGIVEDWQNCSCHQTPFFFCSHITKQGVFLNRRACWMNRND